MDLLYSTENYTQYLLKHIREKLYICVCVCVCVYVCMCVYIYLNHFAVHLKLIQYCKSTIQQLKKNSEVKACSNIKIHTYK